jgi:hypothetical protein
MALSALFWLIVPLLFAVALVDLLTASPSRRAKIWRRLILWDEPEESDSQVQADNAYFASRRQQANRQD